VSGVHGGEKLHEPGSRPRKTSTAGLADVSIFVNGAHRCIELVSAMHNVKRDDQAS
jgi:hypothetical protein